jgi:hypothetical protein
MLSPLQKVTAALDKGEEPNIEDLGQALMEAIKERDACQQMLKDMAGWMSKLVVAHMKKDAITIKQILDDFMAKHVTVVDQTADRKVH